MSSGNGSDGGARTGCGGNGSGGGIGGGCVMDNADVFPTYFHVHAESMNPKMTWTWDTMVSFCSPPFDPALCKMFAGSELQVVVTQYRATEPTPQATFAALVLETKKKRVKFEELCTLFCNKEFTKSTALKFLEPFSDSDDNDFDSSNTTTSQPVKAQVMHAWYNPSLGFLSVDPRRAAAEPNQQPDEAPFLHDLDQFPQLARAAPLSPIAPPPQTTTETAETHDASAWPTAVGKENDFPPLRRQQTWAPRERQEEPRRRMPLGALADNYLNVAQGVGHSANL